MNIIEVIKSNVDKMTKSEHTVATYFFETNHLSKLARVSLIA